MNWQDESSRSTAPRTVISKWSNRCGRVARGIDQSPRGGEDRSTMGSVSWMVRESYWSWNQQTQVQSFPGNGLCLELWRASLSESLLFLPVIISCSAITPNKHWKCGNNSARWRPPKSSRKQARYVSHDVYIPYRKLRTSTRIDWTAKPGYSSMGTQQTTSHDATRLISITN